MTARPGVAGWLGRWWDGLRGRLVDPALRPALVGGGAGLLSWLVGLGVADALLVAGVVGVLALVMSTATLGADHEFPEARDEATDGTRREVAALTWSLVGREGRVSEAAVRHLRSVTRRRLAAHGVVLDATLDGPPERTDRARTLLGERAWQVVTGPGGWMPTMGELSHAVDALERLGPPPTPYRTPTRGAP